MEAEAFVGLFIIFVIFVDLFVRFVLFVLFVLFIIFVSAEFEFATGGFASAWYDGCSCYDATDYSGEYAAGSSSRADR